VPGISKSFRFSTARLATIVEVDCLNHAQCVGLKELSPGKQNLKPLRRGSGFAAPARALTRLRGPGSVKFCTAASCSLAVENFVGLFRRGRGGLACIGDAVPRSLPKFFKTSPRFCVNAGFRIFIITKIRTAISSISHKFSRPKSVGLSSTFEVRTFFYNQVRSCHVALDTGILLDFNSVTRTKITLHRRPPEKSQSV
jgi:hypothetical protein